MKSLWIIPHLLAASVTPVLAQATAPATAEVAPPEAMKSVLLPANEPGRAATQPAALSNTRSATRNVRVWTESRPDVDGLTAFLYQRANELAPAVVRLPGTTAGEWFSVLPIAAANWVELRMEVNLVAAGARPAAKEFLDEMVTAVETFLRDDFRRWRLEQAEPLEHARLDANRRLQEARARLSDIRAKMRQHADRSDVSGKGIADALTKLEEERQKLELDAMGKGARRDALERQVAAQSAAVEKKTAEDLIAAELAKVVEAREQKAKQMQAMAAAANASQADVTDAIAHAAEARAKLLERQRDAGGEAGGEAIVLLNRELLTLSVDLHELDARLHYVRRHLDGLRSASDLADDAQAAETEWQEARAEWKSVTDELRALARSTARPPRVVVTGGTANVPVETPPGSGGGGGSQPKSGEEH